MKTIFEHALEICLWFIRKGKKAYIVGGAARDYYWRYLEGNMIYPDDATVGDMDIEVFGLPRNEVDVHLTAMGYNLDFVGQSFGVFKIKGLPIEVSIPREETKTGEKHNDFSINFKPDATLAQACNRRDFTINALYLLPNETGIEFVDPTGRAKADITNRHLAVVSPQTFVEDPLRILRGMQFIARFGLSWSSETTQLAKNMSIKGLTQERIFGEWTKLLMKGKYFENAFRFLTGSGWYKYFPEIEKMFWCQQCPDFHPEGDVLRHTALCLEQFGKLPQDHPSKKLSVALAILCHDMGKPYTTVWDTSKSKPEPHWKAPGHEHFLTPATLFLRRLTNSETLISEVLMLCSHHMEPYSFYEGKASMSSFRRLSLEVNLQDLACVSLCDQNGRGPTVEYTTEPTDWFLNKARELKILTSKPKPIIKGRHLIALGVKPGVKMGEVLDKLYQMQLDGEVVEPQSIT